MTTVRQILQGKGSDVWSVTSTTTAFDAIKLMADKNIGALLVIDDGQVVGIMSERDYARKVALQGRVSKSTSVKDIMTADVISVRPDQTVDSCMVLMTDKHIRHLPVIDADDNLLGLISIGDVVKMVISEQQLMIDHLQGYIAGTG